MIQLLYVSNASKELEGEKGIQDILKEAREFNAKNGITGVLMFRGGIFLQLLEGEEEVVTQLYEKIEKDPRHDNVINILKTKTDKRLYEEWDMGFKEVSDLDVKFVNEILSWNKLITNAEEIDEKLILHMLTRFKERVS